MPRAVLRIVGALCILGVLWFGISYTNALKAAVDYLRIVSIRDEMSYQEVKNILYPIASTEVQALVFSKEHYEGPAYPPITYVVNNVQGSVTGFDSYEFLVTWTLNNNDTIQSLLTVRHGVVIDAHAVGE